MHIHIVMYGQEIPGVGIILDPELNREGIWQRERGDRHDLDKKTTYYPENDSWRVVRVTKGSCCSGCSAVLYCVNK